MLGDNNFSGLKRYEFEMFRRIWDKEIKKIEDDVMDNRGSWLVYNRFKTDALFILMNMTPFEIKDISAEMEILESRLAKTLEDARTRYRTRNHSLRVRIGEDIAGILRGVPKA